MYGISRANMKKLQRVQNALIRVICSLGPRDSVSGARRDLHWLPIEQRIIFKIAVLTFNCRQRSAPPYLCDLVHDYRPRRALRSGDGATLEGRLNIGRSVVISRLDYCNSLMYGISRANMKKLQRVQNALIRVICSLGPRDSVSGARRDLHWLPIEQRIIFKIAVLTFNCRQRSAPPYLCDLVHDYRPRRALRSGDGATLEGRLNIGRSVVISRLDYCNSLMYGISRANMKKLQRVQNALIRVICSLGPRDSVSGARRDLHWLPIEQRIIFKIAVLTFNCRQRSAPPYLCDLR